VRGAWLARTESCRRGLVLGLLALCAFEAPGADRQLRSRVEVGFDSYLQRFRLSDEVLSDDLDAPDAFDRVALRDTTEVFREFRSLAELELIDRREGGRLSLRGRVSAGSESMRQATVLETRMGGFDDRNRLDLAGDFEARQFRSGGDYELQSDVVQLSARMHARRRVREGTQLGLRLRGANEDYARPSEYEQDQRRLDLSATFEIESGFDWIHALEVGVGWRELPDTTQISSDRIFAHDELHWRNDRWFLLVQAAGDRRVFRDADVRSAYWDVLLEPSLGRQLAANWRLTAKGLAELLDYDRDSSVYFDYWTGHGGVELAWQRPRWSLGVEPRFGWLAAAAEIEDRYRQLSLVTRFDWFGAGRLWLTLSEELGQREYADAGDGIDLYSDYWFLRTTLLLSLRLSDWLNCDAFLSDEPERHRDAVDDGRLTLFSASLRATF
jgi:hypothetical protein